MTFKESSGPKLIPRETIDIVFAMTVSLTQPTDSDWTQIYLYVATQTYRRWNKGEMPSDIAVDSISDYQLGELKRLKAWLHRQRSQAMIEND